MSLLYHKGAPARGFDAAQGARLGELLVGRGIISQEQLDAALARHREVGDPLGQVLLASEAIWRRALYEALGELWGVPVAEVDDVDETLAHSFDPHQLALEGWVPIRIERGTRGRVAAAALTLTFAAAVVVVCFVLAPWSLEHAG
jgi:glycosyltransferase XagB